MFELRDVVPLEVLARFGPRVERRCEDAPVLEAILETGDVGRHQLEKELPDAPALGPRREGDTQVGLADPGPRDETHGRVERLTNLLPVERDVPAIVRIIEPESAGAIPFAT